MPSIRIVCFDWGGVILRHCRGWEEGCAAAGLPVRDGSLDPALIAARRALTAEFQRGLLTSDEFFHRLAAANRHLYTIDELRRLHHCWLLTEYEGMSDVIHRLNQTPRIETALLSNTNEEHWRRHLPVNGDPPDYPTALLLQHRHASHLLGLAKPDETIYRRFGELVGASPQEILFFDDLPDNIAAAERLGWRCELVDHNADTAAQVTRALIQHRVWSEQFISRG